MRWAALTPAISALLACSDPGVCPPDELAAEPGVYGSVQTGCELGGCKPEPGATVALYVAAPENVPPPAGELVRSTMTDASGRFALAATSGAYDLCWDRAGSYLCTRVMIPAGPIQFDVRDGDLGRAQWFEGACP